MSRTSPTTESTILRCLEANRAAAKTPGMIRFSDECLSEYRRTLERRSDRTVFRNPMERFCESLTSEQP